MTAQRRNVFRMLESLPAVFDLRDMEIFLGLSRKTATQYCWRWSSQEFIRSAGPKTGVFFNIVRDRNADAHEREAVEKAIRNPVVVIGASALHEHGWTTQMSRRTEIAVAVNRENQSFPVVDTVSAVPRSLRWFSAVFPRSKPGAGGYRVAPPEFALVDAVMWGDRFRSLPKARQEELRAANRTIWSPDPDDIDVDTDPEEAVSRILAAGEALGADRERLLGYMEDVDALRDAVQERAGGMRR